MNGLRLAAVVSRGIRAILTRRAEASVKQAARRAERLADEIDWPPETRV